MKKLLLLIITIQNIFVFGQNIEQQKKIDSLQSKLDMVSDTNKISILLEISNIYRNFETDNSLKYCNKAIDLSKKINDNNKLYDCYILKGIIYYRLGENKKAVSIFNSVIKNIKEDNFTKGKAYLNLGNIYADLANYDSSLFFYNRSLNVFKKLNDKKSEAISLSNIGTVYSDLGEYDKAISYYSKAQNIHKQYGNKMAEAASIENIGVIYYYQKNYIKALEYFNSSIDILSKTGRYDKMGNTYNNIASIYLLMGNNNEAIKNFKIAEDLFVKVDYKSGQAEVLQNLSNLYFKTNKKDKGIKALNKAISIFKQLNYKKDLGLSYKVFGNYYLEIEDYQKSLMYLKKSLEIIEPLEVKNDLRELYHLLAIVNTKSKNFKDATIYYEKFIVLNDTITNSEKSKQLAEMQTKYDTEKKEQALKLKNIQYEKEKLENKRKTTQRNFTMVGLLLVIILIIIVLRSYRIKRKANILLEKQKHEISEKNEELNQQNEEIIAQRDEIENQRDEVIKQKEKIEKINDEVSESIDYATRLQGAILSEEKILEKYISEHFVSFKPKDKVSGDFYWWANIENHTVITAADCTGHGVPGAFMSMLGASLLREIVQKEYITHTGVILRKLRKEIIKSLKQKGESGEQKDGMDMAIISIDHQTNIVQFSGANNPLYIITNSELQITNDKIIKQDNSNFFYEVKPDKMPIAIYERMDKFATNEIPLEKGDQLYMFSDGFADQFGGPKGKKFKYKPFKQLLIENTDKPMSEQKQILEKTFLEWKGKYEQVDDVTVLGIKI